MWIPVANPPRVRWPELVRILPSVLSLALAGGVLAQTIVVSAASSLTESFEELAAVFEAGNEGARVDLNLAGSSTLRAQIVQGAPVAVFASADEMQMDLVVAAGVVEGEPYVFARNRLVVITPPGSPVQSVEDLADPGVTVVLAGPEVPVGAYARDTLVRLDAAYGDGFAASALANVVSEEPNVRLVAAKVALGEADAAIVYATDAQAVDGLETIRIDDEHNVIARYPIAVLADTRHPEAARAFVKLVLSPEAKALFARYGFEVSD